MKVQHGVLAGLGVVLVLLAFFFLLYRPAGDDIAAAEQAAEVARQGQAEQRQRIRALEEARSAAPDVEAMLATARSVLPDEVGMPSALRQVQDAANGAGVEIMTLTPSSAQPHPLDPTLSEVSVGLQVEGSYFQVVDFLRRIEDPRLTARAMLGDFVVLKLSDYPTLTAELGLRLHARTPASPGAEPAAEPAPAGEDTSSEASSGDAPPPPPSSEDGPPPAPADDDTQVEALAAGGRP